MAAVPPNDWWQVKYHTNTMTRTGGQSTPGVAYVEAPDAATAKKKVEASKGLQPAQIDSVSGPMDPHSKDMAVGGNPVTGAINIAKNPFKFALGATGVAAWFVRGMKVVFGGTLIIFGLAKITGTENALKAAVPAAIPYARPFVEGALGKNPGSLTKSSIKSSAKATAHNAGRISTGRLGRVKGGFFSE